MGGKSAEREISLKSGNAVLCALKEEGVDAIPVEPGTNLIANLLAQNIDRVFIALHGSSGEDGTIQGALEIAEIPYTGSGVLASAMGMDKAKSKLIWTSLGISTPQFQLLTGDTDNESIIVEYPLAVKPVSEGSSLGIHKVNKKSELQASVQSARAYGETVLLEHWVEGADYTVTVLNGRALPAVRMNTRHEFFDFDAKYKDDATEYQCPCGLSTEQEREMAALSIDAFNTLECSGWGRVDLMRDAEGKCWVLEVNTVPGMTDHSLVPMAAAAAGLPYSKLVLEILATSFH
ncbi:MAG: D-alanine--D-alanine ligase [Pseudomonadales bacterium]|nr:D-alanine--D-alanine ligase [Pseudomonadales bacterium]